MDDLVTFALLATSAFLAAVGLGLLARYRQVSGKIGESISLGKDLWGALDTRLKKQDERILDMMGRVEVIQSRVLSGQVQLVGSVSAPFTSKLVEVKLGRPTTSHSEKGVGQHDIPRDDVASEVTSHLEVGGETEGEREEREETRPMSGQETPDARFAIQEERFSQLLDRLTSIEGKLSDRPPMVSRAISPLSAKSAVRTKGPIKVAERELLNMLAEKPRTSNDIVERFDITREHASRVLDALFERGLAKKDDAHKPYVFELTAEGRKLAAAG